jgi:hypothetical protein
MLMEVMLMLMLMPMMMGDDEDDERKAGERKGKGASRIFGKPHVVLNLSDQRRLDAADSGGSRQSHQIDSRRQTFDSPNGSLNSGLNFAINYTCA